MAPLIRIVWLVVASVLLAAVGGCSDQGENAGVQPAVAANPPVLAAGEERNFQRVEEGRLTRVDQSHRVVEPSRSRDVLVMSSELGVR